MKNKNIRKINDKLISKNKEIFGYKALFLCPKGSTGASTHQDSLYYSPAQGFITSWLSLVDLYNDNMGNLVVYPKTHRGDWKSKKKM